MNKEAVKIIREGWVQRKKGYRVQFEKFGDSEWMADYIPAMSEKPWTSDISTWELARRFAASVKPVNDTYEQANSPQ